MTTILIIIGFLLVLAALAGCFLPAIPGPPLGFLALIVLSIAKDGEAFSTTFLIVMACLTALVTGLDYVLPAIGAKKYGASTSGVWVSIAGMVIGFFLLPPWGMLAGAFLGALIGELITGKGGKQMFRAGWGVLVGNLLGIGLKLALSGVMFFFYVKEMF
ncbi:MAG: DUF456 domain-containing protein [Deltaproteobacteria bacterium]|nr:DUF456 domain-containing protein [Deltaproteobacteria bacterium]